MLNFVKIICRIKSFQRLDFDRSACMAAICQAVPTNEQLLEKRLGKKMYLKFKSIIFGVPIFK